MSQLFPLEIKKEEDFPDFYVPNENSHRHPLFQDIGGLSSQNQDDGCVSEFDDAPMPSSSEATKVEPDYFPQEEKIEPEIPVLKSAKFACEPRKKTATKTEVKKSLYCCMNWLKDRPCCPFCSKKVPFANDEDWIADHIYKYHQEKAINVHSEFLQLATFLSGGEFGLDPFVKHEESRKFSCILYKSGCTKHFLSLALLIQHLQVSHPHFFITTLMERSLPNLKELMLLGHIHSTQFPMHTYDLVHAVTHNFDFSTFEKSKKQMPVKRKMLDKTRQTLPPKQCRQEPTVSTSIKCQVCDYIANTPEHLLCHRAVVHRATKPSTSEMLIINSVYACVQFMKNPSHCPFCDQELLSSNLEFIAEHIIDVHPSVARAMDRELLILHKSLHTMRDNVANKFNCSFACAERFDTLKAFKGHLVKMHGLFFDKILYEPGNMSNLLQLRCGHEVQHLQKNQGAEVDQCSIGDAQFVPLPKINQKERNQNEARKKPESNDKEVPSYLLKKELQTNATHQYSGQIAVQVLYVPTQPGSAKVEGVRKPESSRENEKEAMKTQTASSGIQTRSQARIDDLASKQYTYTLDKCPICAYSPGQYTNFSYVEHMYNSHVNTSSFATLFNNYILWRAGSRQFFCPYCAVQFAQMESVSEHIFDCHANMVMAVQDETKRLDRFIEKKHANRGKHCCTFGCSGKEYNASGEAAFCAAFSPSAPIIISKLHLQIMHPFQYLKILKSLNLTELIKLKTWNIKHSKVITAQGVSVLLKTYSCLICSLVCMSEQQWIDHAIASHCFTA